MRKSTFVMAALAAGFIAAAPAAAQDRGMQVSIDASVNYSLQHVKDSGTYHSVLVSPQLTFYYAEPNGSGPYIAFGDALFSSILSSPSDAEPTDATKINASQIYGQLGYRFHILNPATNLTIGVGYLNQKIDTESDKYGHGFFVGVGFSVPIFSAPLTP
ncbi:MAG TPA: outer membrane beta-barrel protein [Sphingomicrobium sp.]|nr:outer membrane beta-barrel protein [Sphingomicrobium sp.]